MSEHASNFELPKNIEHYLAVLSKLYAQDGKRQFQEIIVNAQIRVHEAWSSDNWNGGTYGPGLVSYLNRLGNRQFKYSSNWLIELVI